MKRVLAAIFVVAAVVESTAQSVYPGQFADRIKRGSIPTAAVCFDLRDVRLLPSRFRENMERDSAWMASVSVDRLLHSFYTNAGVWAGREGGYMTVKKYGGWESLDCELRGHTAGHLMSACALMYASTGDEMFRIKGDSIVSGLAAVQRALGNGYLSAFPEELINRNIRSESVWAPWYTLHKILAGLLDQYLYAGNDEALRIATAMGDWAADKLKDIDDGTRRKMLRNEFGGINESFYNLYACTGDERYVGLAEFFCHDEVIDPLREHDTDFGTKHTNTFIPKVLGEMRRHELTGEEPSRDLSEFFWHEMIEHHVFATGCLSDKEHYFDPAHLSEHISGYTGETCCTYNMLKLCRHLFCCNPSAALFDYYERALYNHILGQQDPATGMVAYFLPQLTGSHKVYSTPEESFWCCVGSGFESHAKYAESIWFASADDSAVFVNLFIPSELNWHSRGIRIVQTTSFPAEPSTLLTFAAEKPTSATIRIRRPSWASDMKIRVNGKSRKVKVDKEGYADVEGLWRDGDRIEVGFGMELHTESPADNASVGALLYGPIVMAGRLGTEGMVDPAPSSNPALYNDYYTYDYRIPEDMSPRLDVSKLERTAPLQWRTTEGVTVEPLYDIHHERYVVYWPLTSGER